MLTVAACEQARPANALAKILNTMVVTLLIMILAYTHVGLYFESLITLLLLMLVLARVQGAVSW